MKFFKAVLAAAATALSAAAGAQSASDIRITIERQSDEVTYSADGTAKSGKNAAQLPLVTFSSYKVTVRNAGETSNNTVNNVLFRAATRVATATLPVGTRAAPFAAPSTGDVTTCSTAVAPADWSYTTSTTPVLYTPIAGTYIECPIGQLRVGDTKTFFIYFLAPKAPSPLVAESINLDSRLNYAEGANDSAGASRVDTQQGTVSVGLGTFNPTKIKSAVPPNKLVELFTGQYGVATGTDQWTTTIKVPSANTTNAKATIDEPLPSCTFGTTVLCLVSADISITDSNDALVTLPASSPLVFKLRRDASTIPSGSRIRDAVVTYQGNTDPNPLPLPDCGVYPLGSTGPDAQPVKRCEVRSARIEYKNNNAPTSEYVGDWEFTVQATENGKYSW
jgi:hypothetical protein